MKYIKFRTWVLILLALLIALSGYAAAKYVQTKTLGGTVTFTAKLAEEFYLRETEIIRQDDGNYTLGSEYVYNTQQTYVLIPGVDIPKDPHIVIKGKTPNIPAYLFLEVVDSTPNNSLVFSLSENWISAASLKQPQHDGMVYVYSADKNAPTPITQDYEKITILTGDTVTVKQGLKTNHDKDPNSLTFYAYLEEIPPENKT